jgi:hypothetical protein
MKRVALLLLLLLSCGRVDVDIGDLPPNFCTEDINCPSGNVCDKTCTDPSGKCRKKDPTCDPMLVMPQCGCDGVLYANECLRLHADAGFDPDGCQ